VFEMTLKGPYIVLERCLKVQGGNSVATGRAGREIEAPSWPTRIGKRAIAVFYGRI